MTGSSGARSSGSSVTTRRQPEKGGARKSTATKPREWLENTREQWADHANEALERAGRSERITEASLENQYWEAAEAGNEREMARLQNREPGVHIGPHNVARAERGEDLDRVAEAGDAADRNRVGWIEGRWRGWTSKSARSPSRSRSRYERRGTGAPISI